MNMVTIMFLALALFSVLIPAPKIGGHRVCVKAYIGDRMFNKHVVLTEVPRQGDWFGAGRYSRRVEQVRWTDYSTLVFLEDDQGDQAESEILAAGFTELRLKQ